jgi:hypothetical protein
MELIKIRLGPLLEFDTDQRDTHQPTTFKSSNDLLFKKLKN